MMQWSKETVFLPSAVSTSTMCGPVNFATPVTTCTLRCLASPARPLVPPDDALLPAAQLVQIDAGLAELEAEVRHLLGFRDHARGVQQRLRRDAADVQADAAEVGVALDQHHLLAEVGGAEGGGVAARPGAEHHDLGVEVAAA